MKRSYISRLLIFAVLAVFSAFSLVSCSGENGSELELYFPVFASAPSISSRGLTDLGIFNNDKGGGTAVLTYTPMMQAVRREYIKPSNIPNYLRGNYRDFDVYGFDCNIYDEYGIDDVFNFEWGEYLYIRFYVAEGRTAGIIDYCYDIRNRRFSYREFIFLSLQPADGADANGYPRIPAVLSIQYDDIPIEWDGSFSTFDGHAQDNVIVDLFTLNQDGTGNLQRYFPIAKSEGDEIAIFIDPDENEEYAVRLSAKALKQLKDEKDGIGDDLLINVGEVEKFGHRDFRILIHEYYENGGSLEHRDPRNYQGRADDYSSYEDYRSDSIRYIKYEDEKQPGFGAEDFVIFNFKTTDYATLRNDKYMEEGMGIITPDTTKEELEQMGFDRFYPLFFSGENFRAEDLVRAHLEKAGADPGYIDDYVERWKARHNF